MHQQLRSQSEQTGLLAARITVQHRELSVHAQVEHSKTLTTIRCSTDNPYCVRCKISGLGQAVNTHQLLAAQSRRACWWSTSRAKRPHAQQPCCVTHLATGHSRTTALHHSAQQAHSPHSPRSLLLHPPPGNHRVTLTHVLLPRCSTRAGWQSASPFTHGVCVPAACCSERWAFLPQHPSQPPLLLPLCLSDAAKQLELTGGERPGVLVLQPPARCRLPLLLHQPPLHPLQQGHPPAEAGEGHLQAARPKERAGM